MRLEIQDQLLFVYQQTGMALYQYQEFWSKLRIAGAFHRRPSISAYVAEYSDSTVAWLLELFPNLQVTDAHTLDRLNLVKGRERKRRRVISRLQQLRASGEVELSGYVFNQYEPFQHQKIALTILDPSHPEAPTVLALFADCGTGKTLVALHWIKALKALLPDLKALVVAPRNVLRGAWLKDCEKFTPELSTTVLSGLSADSKRKTLTLGFKSLKKNRKSDIYLINPEGMIPRKSGGKTSKTQHGFVQDLIDFKFDVVVVDESSMMKNWTSSTTKSLIRLGDSVKYRLIMSGTPAPNSPLEYFPQIRFLSKRVFGSNFVAHRAEFFSNQSFGEFPDYRLAPSKHDEFLERLHTYSLRFREEDCLDLEPLVDHEINVTLDKTSWSRYQSFLKEAVLTMCQMTGAPASSNSWNSPSSVQTIAAANGLDKILKAREITSGFLMWKDATDTQKIADIHAAKFEALSDLLKEISISQPKDEVAVPVRQQVVIWGWFRYELEKIQKLLGGPSNCALIYGGLSAKVAAQRQSDFQAGRVQYLAAHPKSLGHGQTLCEQEAGNPYPQCHRQVAFSLSYSSELYHQMRKRIHRAGQKLPVHMWHLLATSPRGGRSIDYALLSVVQGKLHDEAKVINAILETANRE